jgi:hypothetical protein
MPFIIADRVRETSITTGTGSIALAGAVTGYQSFDAVLDTADTTFYTIADQSGSNWEVGIGTFTAPTTLARTTILSSSNGGSVVTFGAGTKDVFISLPASRTNVEDQPNLIEVNSSSAALRITQTGAGNALVVEDSSNPDATPFVVSAAGDVGIGTSTPTVKLDVNGSINGTWAGATIAVANGGTGATTLTGLVVGNGASAFTAVTAPSGAVVGTTDTQTLTNKRVTPRIGTVGTATTITPTGDTADQYNITALGSAATIAAPSGTPVDGQHLILRFKDNGTVRALTWTTSSGAYRAVGVTLPTTTVASKATYVGCIYNAQDVFWDVVAAVTQA